MNIIEFIKKIFKKDEHSLKELVDITSLLKMPSNE